MLTESNMAFLFMLTITLHNVEEGLWLPQWSHLAKEYHEPVEPGAFHFALIVITAMAYLVSGLFLMFPEMKIVQYLFCSYVGAMAVNAFDPT